MKKEVLISISLSREVNRLLRTMMYMFVLPILLSVGFIRMETAEAAEKGRIVSVKMNKDTFKPNETIRVFVTVQSFEKGQRHHLVVLNILDKDGNAVYDSHIVSEDIDLLIGQNEKKSVGPFTFKWPADTRAGVYSLFIGYRVYPWEPLIEFQGDTWHPPIRKIRVR